MPAETEVYGLRIAKTELAALRNLHPAEKPSKVIRQLIRQHILIMQQRNEDLKEFV